MRIPARHGADPYPLASLGVAFVAASIALGVCLGVDFPSFSAYPPLSLLSLAQRQEKHLIPSDAESEVLENKCIPAGSRPHAGEWILIYGGE